MQGQDRAQVFAVVCRQAGTSVQVLLQKVGRGPPTDKRWAFIGGATQPSEDGGDQYYAALLRMLNKTCNNDVPPRFQLQHFAVTNNPSKPISYHVVTVPPGNDAWPSNRDANDSVTIGGHTFTSKQGGFMWVDYGNLLRSQGTNPSAVHIGVLQWFSQNGDVILNRLGFNSTQATVAGGQNVSGGNRIPCKFIVQGQTCPYGNNCRFVHDTTPAAPPPSPVAATAAPPPAMDPTQMRMPKLNNAALAEMFLTHYFTNFAAGSEAIMALYQPTSVLTFDGQAAIGPQQIAERLKALHAQQIKLQPNTLFVQGVPGGGILVSTSGALASATQVGQTWPFAMVFHLQLHGTNWIVSNQIWWLLK